MARDKRKEHPVIEGEVMEHDINPKCIQRTAEALAEGHEIVQALELKVEEMRRERERIHGVSLGT